MNKCFFTAFLFLCLSCDATRTCMDFPDEPAPVRGSVYAVAVEYDAGYDWKRDSLPAESCPMIGFYRDSVRLFGIPAGGGGPGIDADMHRIAGFHLYSDYPVAGGTAVARDGKELFRYTENEMICGLAVRDSTVFTLGCRRDGAGWSFRANGKRIMERDTGCPVGSLYTDNGELCFAYRIPVHTGGDGRTGQKFYLMTEDVDTHLEIPDDVASVLDIRRHRGEVNVLAYSQGCDGVVWLCGAHRDTLDVEGGGYEDYSRFVTADSLLIAVETAYQGWGHRTYFWSRGRKRITRTEAPSISTVCSVCDGMPALCFATTSGPTMDYAYYDGRKSLFGRKYELRSSGALCCDRNGFAIGLNDTDDNLRPLIFRGRDTLRYDFNGYFIHLALP